MTKTRTISLALAGILALSTAALAQDDGDSRNLGQQDRNSGQQN